MTRLAIHLAAALVLAAVATESRACPAALAPDGTGIAAGCPVPVDATCWALEDGAAVIGRLARGAEAEARLVELRTTERAECETETMVLRRDLDTAAAALSASAASARDCAADVDALRREKAPPAPPSPVLPPWAWALSGAVAPLVGLGACALADCDTTGRRWAASGAAGAVVLAAVALEW